MIKMMMKSIFNFLFGLFFFGLLVADEIRTHDGSLIQGTIWGMEDGNLTIKTSFAGKIKIPYDQINSFTSDAPLTFRMDDNRTLNGTVQFAQDGNFTISDQGEKFSLQKSDTFGLRIWMIL